MTDLDKLIAAVDGDTLAPDDGVFEFATPNQARWAAAAYQGSLDAAHRLHDALLPGWAWTRKVYFGPKAVVGVWELPTFGMGHTAREVDGNTARAWLLAILRALKAQGVL